MSTADGRPRLCVSFLLSFCCDFHLISSLSSSFVAFFSFALFACCRLRWTDNGRLPLSFFMTLPTLIYVWFLSDFYRLLLGLISYRWSYRVFDGVYRVLPRFTGFYWVLPGFTGFYRVLTSFTGFYWLVSSLIEFSMELNRFYRVLPGFTGFYRVLPGFT